MVSVSDEAKLLVLAFCLSCSRCQDMRYHNNEYRMRLIKSDPFIDGFVPTEYTSGFSKYKNVKEERVCFEIL
jgi:hypothetical protein